MGKSKEDGVVDGYGNVFGVENLIVADASIAPIQNDGNTAAPAFLIGFVIAKHLAKHNC
jgi:choline dehydrogenase